MCGHCGTTASLEGAERDSGLTRRPGFDPAASTRSPDFIESGAATHSLKLHVILLEPQNENYCGKNMFIVLQMPLCLCIGI